MKQIIRYNTFETNSSSMHSLVITKKARPYTEWENKLGYYDYYFELFDDYRGSTFERYPFQVLSTPKEKLQYYVAHYIGYRKETKRLKEIEDLVYELTGCPRDKIQLYCYEDYAWRNKQEKFYGWAGINDTGEDVFDYIEKNNISLKEFILDPRYTVIIDGDEYQHFKELFLKGIANFDNIEYISSGKAFWVDSIKTLSLYFINIINDESYAELMEEINNYTNDWVEKIQIEDEEEDINYSNLEYLKSFLEGVKAIKPNMQIELLLKIHSKEDYKEILEFINKIEKI